MSTSRRSRIVSGAGVVLAVALSAFGHDIPESIPVQMYVKPSGERLHVLTRVPLTLLLNLDLPKRGPGYLDLDALGGEARLRDAIEAITEELFFYEEDERLRLVAGAARISLPSDRSFASFEEAAAHIRVEPLDTSTDLFWNQGFFDAHLEYAIRSEQSGFSMESFIGAGLADRLTVTTSFEIPGGGARTFVLGDRSDRVWFDPRWYRAGLVFLESGFFHILGGLDHLLFLMCLMIPARRLRHLVLVITAFTLAHSVTLAAAALGMSPSATWFPPLVETLIALSILVMAIENAVNVSPKRRAALTFGFGLIHGFGFSFALSELLPFAGAHVPLALASFNVGVELGQLLVLALALPAIAWLLEGVRERPGRIILSMLIGHTAWHWMVGRGSVLVQTGFPEAALVGARALLPWLVLATVVSAIVWRWWVNHVRAVNPSSGSS